MQDLLKKLKFKDSGIIINAPAVIEKAFVNLGFKNSFDKTTKSANTLAFVNNLSEAKQFFEQQLASVEFDSVLWLAYPKGSAKTKTDINRDSLREKAEAYGITAVTIVSIDVTWSALRFRPIERVGK